MRRCEREREIAEALRGAGMTAELNSHVAGCTGCRETMRVTRALMALRAVEAPDAGVVWLRAQARAEEQVLLRRATRPLAVMRTLSAVFLGLLALWAAPLAWVLLRGHLPELRVLGTDGVVEAVASAVLVGVGVSCLWYVGRRSPSPVFRH